MPDSQDSGESNSRRSASKFETEILANERTFLAWVRTSVAVMGLGFVVARFGMWLRELGNRINPHATLPTTGVSLPLGAVMMAFGALLTVLAAWRYWVVNRYIERGQIKADPRMVIIITVAIAVAGIAIIIYTLVAAEQT